MVTPDTDYTHHAQTRMQQRCIPPLIVEWLMVYGATQPDHRGAQVRFFNKRAKKALARDVGSVIVKQLARYMDAYIVTRDVTVITAGYRFKRVTH